jgi:hypothetical protein
MLDIMRLISSEYLNGHCTGIFFVVLFHQRNFFGELKIIVKFLENLKLLENMKLKFPANLYSP